MGVPTSEVGYTPAMPRREDHEVHKDMWGHWIKKKEFVDIVVCFHFNNINVNPYSILHDKDRFAARHCT